MDAVPDGEVSQQGEVDCAREGLGARIGEETAVEGEAVEDVEMEELLGGGVGERGGASEEEVFVVVLRPHIAGAAQREYPQRLGRRLHDLADDVVVGGGGGVGGGRAKGREAAVGERREAALKDKREGPQRAHVEQRHVGVGEELFESQMAQIRLRGQRATDAGGPYDARARRWTVVVVAVGGSGGSSRLPAVASGKQASKRHVPSVWLTRTTPACACFQSQPRLAPRRRRRRRGGSSGRT